MDYKRFNIHAYKALIDSPISVLDTPVPLIGVNESGKSSVLEAISRFDYRNDDVIEAKGWKFINRYRPEIEEFSLTSEIEISQQELDEIRKNHPLPKPGETAKPAEEVDENPTRELDADPEPKVEGDKSVDTGTPEEKLDLNHDDLLDITLTRGRISVTRVFNSKENTKNYLVNGYKGDRVENLARDIIARLPRIYYFDNFLETPIPDVVTFSQGYIDGGEDLAEEEQKIVEGAFSSAIVDLRSFFNQKDSATRSTLISKVNTHVTKEVIEDWRKMHISKGEIEELTNLNDVSIEFQLGEDKKSIEITVVERFADENGIVQPGVSLRVNERSLGFRWFFNFSMRKCFAAVHEDRFLYLIDEPGSYLHNSAQTILLDALIDLAKSHPVIYSTHSEFLLDPEKININNIRIVQKEDHAVKVLPLGDASTKKHEGALSTLNNALKMRTPLESIMNKKVIVTEGITDYYFWKPLISTTFLPGCGAGNNRYLLSIAIGSAKKYIALFDGDTAGDNAHQQYKGLFGDNESINWISYEDSKGVPVKLEKLLSTADTTRIKSMTGQNDIKQAITVLFFKKVSGKFWKGTDKETRSNVQHNVNRVSRHLGLNKSSLKQDFTIRKRS